MNIRKILVEFEQKTKQNKKNSLEQKMNLNAFKNSKE